MVAAASEPLAASLPAAMPTGASPAPRLTLQVASSTQRGLCSAILCDSLVTYLMLPDALTLTDNAATLPCLGNVTWHAPHQGSHLKSLRAE